jgi:hypothetical protein
MTIPLRHALGCCGSDRHLLSRIAAHLLDEPAHTRSARKARRQRRAFASQSARLLSRRRDPLASRHRPFRT